MTLPSVNVNFVGSGFKCGEFDRIPRRLCGDLDYAVLIPVVAIEWLRLSRDTPKLLKSPPLTTSGIALGIAFFPASVFRFGITGPPGLLGRYPENWYAASGLATPALGPKAVGRDAASDKLLWTELF